MQVSCVLADDEVMLTIKPGQVCPLKTGVLGPGASAWMVSLLFKDFTQCDLDV